MTNYKSAFLARLTAARIPETEVYHDALDAFVGFYHHATPYGKKLLDAFSAKDDRKLVLRGNKMPYYSIGPIRFEFANETKSTSYQIFNKSIVFYYNGLCPEESRKKNPVFEELKYRENDMIHEAAHWLDNNHFPHSQSALFNTLIYPIANYTDPNYLNNIYRIREQNNYTEQKRKSEEKKEEFCILAECLLGQRGAPDWIPDIIRDYFDKIVKIHIDISVYSPNSLGLFSRELGKHIIMNDDEREMMRGIIKGDIHPDHKIVKKMVNGILDRIVNNVRREMGEEAKFIPSLQRGRAH